MRASVVKPAELGTSELETWLRYWGSLSYPTPCLRPELFVALGKQNSAVRVGVLQRDCEIVGFLPFLSSERGQTGAPIPGADYQAIVARPDAQVDVAAAVRACGLKTWRVEHLIELESAISPRQDLRSSVAQVMDVRGGYEGYVAQVSSGRFKEIQRRLRKLERDLGPLRHVNELNPRLLEQLLHWKAPRFGHGEQWVQSCMATMSELMEGSALGRLRVLWAGETIVSLNYGLHAGEIFHVWFNAFDPRLVPYSPGAQGHLALARDAGLVGARFFDFGHGGEEYKTWICNETHSGFRGVIDTNPVTRWLRRTSHQFRTALQSSPTVYAALRRGMKAIREIELR